MNLIKLSYILAAVLKQNAEINRLGGCWSRFENASRIASIGHIKAVCQEQVDIIQNVC